MIQDVIREIQASREEILAKAQSAKIFLELSDQKRLMRASDILRADKVKIQQQSLEEILGECIPSDSSGESYRVSFRVRAFRVRGATCTCHDGQNGEVCKHALALCMRWLLDLQSSWKKLEEARKVLLGSPQP